MSHAFSMLAGVFITIAALKTSAAESAWCLFAVLSFLAAAAAAIAQSEERKR